MPGKNKRWNLRQAKKAGKRRVTPITEVESGELGRGWFYRIERWDLSSGATEFGLRVFHQDAFGVQGPVSWKLYGELDHAQQAVQPCVAELRKASEM